MSLPLRTLLIVSLLLCAATPSLARAEDLCPGDCNADGTIDDGDLLRIVRAIFSPDSAVVCPGLVGELATAVAADLVSAVARGGGECVPLEPPVIPAQAIYRTYPGYEIALPIGAESANGPLQYVSDDLPEGAVLEADTGILRWTPGEEQTGAYVIHFRVTDHAVPTGQADGTLGIRVTPLDSCAMPTCDPASGCTSTLPPLTQPCCAPGPVGREPEVYIDCPEGQFLMVGRNTNSGFGRMQNCDQLKLIAFTQSGVTIRIHLGARCFTTGKNLSLHTLMEAPDKMHVDREDVIVMQPTSAGFAQRVNFTPEVRDATMALEGQEANLSLTLTDLDTNVQVTETIRVVLTHMSLADLPDLF